MCIASTAPEPSAMNGGRPDSIANMMQPSE